MSPTETTTPSQSVFVKLAARYYLRITLKYDDNNRPSWLVFSRGFGMGDDFVPSHNGDVFCVSAHRLPDVSAALATLAALGDG